MSTRWKSSLAAEMNLYGIRHNQKDCYLWTFTFRHAVHDARLAGEFWNRFSAALTKRGIPFYGQKVLELHDAHGIHFHFVTEKRFHVKTIRAIWQNTGDGNGGRVHVKAIHQRRFRGSELSAGHLLNQDHLCRAQAQLAHKSPPVLDRLCR